MKAIIQLFLLAVLISFSGCITNSNRTYFSGKNKVIKGLDDDKSINNTAVKEDTKPIYFTQNKTIDDTNFNVNDNEVYIEIDRKIEEKTQKTKDRIIQVRSLLENPEINSSIIPGKKAPIKIKSTDDTGDALTIGIVLLIVIILAVLLGILLFYLIIKAINQAAEDAVEESCYIATMTYGDYDHPKVKTLRVFRDDFLAQRKWGKNFIKWYYRNSPSFVNVYKSNKFVNGFLRAHLNVFVFLIKPFYRK